jgi:uncharacterized protein YbjT (DUF2867 family)
VPATLFVADGQCEPHVPDMAKLDVLVVGATGRQGSAVTRALLQGGHRVRALTRSLANPLADKLRQRGARLAWADLDDRSRVDEAAAGAAAIFAVTTSAADDQATELRHGRMLVEIAAAADAHLVYSTFAEPPPGVRLPQLATKAAIEAYMRERGGPYTLVYPAFFMDDLLREPWLGGIHAGRLALPLPEGRKLQQTARIDFARFVRLIIERRHQFLGQRVCIASDELTPVEMAASLARVLGHAVQHDATGRGTAELSVLDLVAITNGGCADVPALRHEFPEVNWHTLDGWARRQDWKERRTT